MPSPHERWSLTRALTGKYCVFWIAGCLWDGGDTWRFDCIHLFKLLYIIFLAIHDFFHRYNSVWGNWHYQLTDIISYFCICLAPFEKFSSDNLGDPVISYAPGEDVAVTLTCEVPLLNLVGTWNNVTYRIEWYAEGKTLLTYERCNVGNCNGKKNNAPCPNANSIQSKLKGTLYKIGQSVSNSKSCGEFNPIIPTPAIKGPCTTYHVITCTDIRRLGLWQTEK